MKTHVVLVRTEYPLNIGSSARALANMGGCRLILIDPRCEINEQAKQMAAGAQSPLRECTIYPTWKEFFEREPDGLRIGLTRRAGRQRKIFSLAEKIQTPEIDEKYEHIYLVFGPEDNGLDANDLAFLNWCCSLPIFGDFGSMNLSHAVLLALYLIQSRFGKAKENAGTAKTQAIQPFYFPDDLIKEWLTAMGFDIRARRSSAYLTLRRLFLHNLPTRHEMQVLEAILQQNIRKLKAARSLGFSAEDTADDLTDIARQ